MHQTEEGERLGVRLGTLNLVLGGIWFLSLASSPPSLAVEHISPHSWCMCYGGSDTPSVPRSRHISQGLVK